MGHRFGNDQDNIGFIGIFGDVLAAPYADDISVQFPYGVNTNYDVTTSVTGDGAEARQLP